MQRPRPAAATAPDPAGLPARLVRGLYQDYDLHTVGGIRIAVPKGVPCFAAPTLAEIARQISSSQYPDPGPPGSGAPPPLPGPRISGSPGTRG